MADLAKWAKVSEFSNGAKNIYYGMLQKALKTCLI
jgi:hypothetical protein